MGLFKNFNFDKLKQGLAKTRNKIVDSIEEAVTGQAQIDSATIEEIEDILIGSDLGIETAEKVVFDVKERMLESKDRSGEQLVRTVKASLMNILTTADDVGEYDPDIQSYKPFVILIIGVNGSGKTTTIGKLAHNFRKSGYSVMVGAADTFRAAANEQLEEWAKRAGVEIVQKAHGADPSSVAYETLDRAIETKTDVIMIDTAGRLHTKKNLMVELQKIKRVISKKLPYAPNETFLVIDGNTGQNALVQSEEFSKVTEISGLIVTKLDGTAKGGAIFQVCARQKIPVRYIGVGEGIDDLQQFDPKMFVEALFEFDEAQT